MEQIVTSHHIHIKCAADCCQNKCDLFSSFWVAPQFFPSQPVPMQKAAGSPFVLDAHANESQIWGGGGRKEGMT